MVMTHFNYSRVETSDSRLSIEAFSKMAKHLSTIKYQLVNFEGETSKEVAFEDKNLTERVKLMHKLE
jgi:hypothetical protein